MTWGFVAAAAVTVVGSVMKGNQEAKATAKQSKAINQAVVESNVANTVRTGYRVGLANMQRGLQKRQTAQTGFDISEGGVSALGQVTANAAASGTIGASVDAVLKDVTMKTGEAQAQLTNQAEIDAVNFDTQLSSIITEGKAQIRGADQTDLPSTGDIWSGALLQGASSFASNYMRSKMKLGAGTAATKTPSSNPATSYGKWGLD